MLKIKHLFCGLLLSCMVLLPAVTLAAPAVSVSTSADPSTVYRKGVDSPDTSTITVKLTGTGEAGVSRSLSDILLVTDISGSMDGQPLIDEQTADNSFVDHMDANYDKIGLVSFATFATLDQGLTTNFASVKTAVSGLTALGATNYEDAILQSTTELTGSNHRSGASKVMIFMSDGDPTLCNDMLACNPVTSAQTAIVAAKAAGITVYTIGSLENLENFSPGQTGAARALLQEMASSTSGTNDHYFEAPTSSDLTSIYNQIANQLINPTAGQNLTFNMKLPSDLELVSDSWSIAPTSSSGGIYSFSIGTLNVNSDWTLTFRSKFNETGTRPVFDTSNTKYSYTNTEGQIGDYAVPQVEVKVIDKTPASGDWTIIFLAVVAILLAVQTIRVVRIIKAKKA